MIQSVENKQIIQNHILKTVDYTFLLIGAPAPKQMSKFKGKDFIKLGCFVFSAWNEV